MVSGLSSIDIVKAPARRAIRVLVFALVGLAALWSAPRDAFAKGGIIKPSPGGQAQGLAAVGPIDPDHGFPRYYQDKNGLALEPCLVSPVVNPLVVGGDPCGLTRTIPQGDFSTVSFPGNFPNEFFYNRAAAVFQKLVNGGNTFTIVFQVQGAFLPTKAAPGNQVAFARIRYDVTGGLVPGATYTITHPYGRNSFIADAAGGLPKNQGVSDQGCIGPPCGAFDQLLTTTNAGPFLVWDPAGPAGAPPTGFAGDPAVLTTILGSPFGTNFVMIEGPNVGGPGINILQTNLFAVWGKIYNPTVLVPSLTVDRSTYARALDGTTRVNVFARTEPGTTVTATLGGVTAALVEDGTGQFFARFPATVVAGDHVTVSATNAIGTTTVVQPIVDEVTIESVSYSASGVLSIQAHSSDQAAPPVLTADTGQRSNPQILGQLSGNALTLTHVPPSIVAVVSSYGGRATRLVDPAPKPAASAQAVASSTVVTSSSLTASAGLVLTFTATVSAPGAAAGSPTGTVVFMSDATTLGSAALNGTSATLSIPFVTVGTTSVIAIYSGDANVLPSTSAPIRQVITKVVSSTVVMSQAASVTMGTPVVFTATITPTNPPALVPGGMVTFMDGATTLGSVGLIGNVAALSGVLLSAGTHTITAIYTGDGSYLPSTSVPYTQLVVPVASSTSLVATPSTVVRRNATTLRATVTAPGVAIPAGTLVTFVSAGGTTGVANGVVLGTGTTDALGVATTTYVAPNRAGTLFVRAVYPGVAGIRTSTSATILLSIR